MSVSKTYLNIMSLQYKTTKISLGKIVERCGFLRPFFFMVSFVETLVRWRKMNRDVTTKAYHKVFCQLKYVFVSCKGKSRKPKQ